GASELYGDHGEQKIGVRFRQIEQLLDARAETHAEPFAAAERDQRMRQLITLVQRVGPWVEKARQALQSIRRRDHDGGERNRKQHRQSEKQAPAESAEKQNAE